MDLKSTQPAPAFRESNTTVQTADKQSTNNPGGFAKLLSQQNNSARRKLAALSSNVTPVILKTTTDEPISLGTISRQAPTVSHLLKQSRHYSKACWKIIYADENKNKNFRNIGAGTEIFIDRKTKEISWENSVSRSTRVASEQTGSSPKPWKPTTVMVPSQKKIPQELDEAVKSYLGAPYRQMDCYSLVLKGLRDLGIKYTGKNGLRSRLVNMSHAAGRPVNAYFNGEGIIEASGRKVYEKSILHVANPGAEAKKVYNELMPLLAKGDILAFSIRTKGHTGIVSQRNDSWTYINSGKLDHSVHSSHPRNGVGEENLRQELANWFKLAANREESLLITLGRLEEKKVAAYMKHSPDWI